MNSNQFEAHPVNQVEWIHRDELYANNYNPNNVPPLELALLKISLMEDGWALPLVVCADRNEIIDGFHRWHLSSDKAIYDLTGGMVPIVRLDVDQVHQVAATIRYNRARGVHHVAKLSDIVIRLKDEHDVDDLDIAARFGMEQEEINRLYEQGKMTERGTSGDVEFGQGWVPDDKKPEEDDDDKRRF